MMSKRRNKRETAQRFSLRKSAFGATSVLLGSVFLMEAGLTTVQADMMIQTTEQDCDCELTSSQTPEEVQKQAEDKVVQWQQADGELSKITQDIVRTDNVILGLEEQIESGLNTHTPQLDENLQKQLSVQNQISTVQEQMKTVEENLTAARQDLSTAELEEEKVRLKVEGAQSEREEIEEKRLNTAIKLGELEKYRADVETWIEGADEQPKLQNWDKFFSDFKEEAEIDKLAKNYVEHYRVVYNTLVAELEDSQKYYEETKQYAIVRHVSNIYEKSYPVARRRAHARSENGWLPKDGVVPASVIYSGTDVVEKLQFDTNYVPSMKNVSQFALEYIKTLRDINGVSANNIEVTERALEYAMKRALEVGELLPGAGGRHNTILKSPGGEPSPVENLANPSNILKYNEELFIHSDKELAYYLILDWFAEYNMRDTDFGHTKNLFNVENAEFGMWNSAGPKSHNYTYELINPENGQYTQSTLLRSGTGVALPSTFSISSRTELDTESGLSRDVKRIQLNRTSEDEYRYTLVKRSGQELFVYARENLTTPGDDRITSAYDVDYADFNHSQLGSGKKFEYSKKVLHPETGTYFRTDSGKWYLLTGDDYQELTDVSEEIKSDSSTRVTPTDAVFLPRTSFIYSVPDEKTYNQELKRIEEKVKTTRNILYTLLEHKESPIKSELVRLQDELQKLDEQLKSTDSAELDLAKEETKKAKDRVNSLETAQVNLQDELQKLEAELLKLKAEEKLIRDELAKVQDKQMEKERLQKDLDSYNRNKSNLENRKKELEKEISLLCAISEEEIPFGKSYQDDASLYEGTEKDITSGQVGIKQIVTSYSLVAGKLRTQETVTTTKEAVNAVIARGTKPTPTPVTVTEYRQIDNGVQEYQVTKLDGKVTEEKPGQIYQNTLETKTVAYTTIKEDDATLTAGTTKVKQAGVNGSRAVGVTYTVENGQLKKTPFDRLVKAAVDEIILVGTRQPVRRTDTTYKSVANGVEEYATDYVDDIQSGHPRLVKTYTNVQSEVIPFEKVQEEDTTLPVGKTKVKQVGINGSRRVGNLYSVEDGQLKVTEVNEVTAATPEITLVGTRQPVRRTDTTYKAIANGVEEYATDFIDEVQSGQPRLVKTHTNAQAEIISFEKVQETDATLLVGETKVKQVGVNGSRLVGNLYSVENGQLKVTEVNEVTAATPEIILVGTRQPEQVEAVPTSPSSEPETPVVEQPTQSELEQAEVVQVEPETETPAVEQPTQLEPEQVEVVPTEPVEQPEPATQPDEELVTAVPDTAPQEDEKPEYIFNPDDFKDVLEPEVEEKADASTEFSRFAGTWVNSIGQSFTISETGAFSGHFNENHVVIHNTNAQGVVVFSNGGPSVVLPSYLPAGYTDAMTTNSDGRLERFVFMGDAWADNRGAFPEIAFFYRLGEKPVLAATEETIPTVANGGRFAGAGALTEPVVDAVAFPAATSQEPATVVAESALPNTGDAVSLISLLGASMVTTAGVGVKRRRR